MDYIKNISNLDKVNIIDNILKDYDLCKILYYQLDIEYTKELCKKYNTILLLRNPFDSFISCKIAENISRWHNNGQNKIIPDKKMFIDPQNMINYVVHCLKCGLNYMPYASKVITYNDINTMWYHNMEYFFQILGKQFKIFDKPFIKNPENPKDFIENYQELRDIYENFYRRLV